MSFKGVKPSLFEEDLLVLFRRQVKKRAINDRPPHYESELYKNISALYTFPHYVLYIYFR